MSNQTRRALRRAARLTTTALALAGAASRLAAQESVRRAFPLDADGAVRVYVLGGRVRVVGGDGDSVVVTGTVPAGRPLHGGGTRRGVKLGVWDERPGAPAAAGAATSLEVRVPRRSRVWVKAGERADVEAVDVAGGLDLNIVAGSVRVRGSPRELNAEAMDGSIEVTGSPAWLRAKTASGAITLRGSSDDVALSSVSGAIRVAGGRVTRGRFESVTGDIRFDGAPERGGALTFDGHSGAIELRLPRAVSADVLVTTIQGAIDNSFPGARGPGRPVVQRDAMRGRELAFSLGDAPLATVTVRSFKGRVTLAPR